ncbi:predicted protein [Pyrenophora tritici-repentis Pt-1C-BFP]|uniref:Uncharacterized protein n=1 Tax=Pyrenophora tritici-repentis (strain Pt-1C-BFP) TaxID=426418 RepID=B2VY67_PYRTR|nr:uncharacterized protein PTRG_02357 [Pyrenophora tritici-repentis Pt-1C-BFP]EDU44880.1 predicted protein [Pyrenophora tritici-repentis Pt-1C-BFP]
MSTSQVMSCCAPSKLRVDLTLDSGAYPGSGDVGLPPSQCGMFDLRTPSPVGADKAPNLRREAPTATTPQTDVQLQQSSRPQRRLVDPRDDRHSLAALRSTQWLDTTYEGPEMFWTRLEGARPLHYPWD